MDEFDPTKYHDAFRERLEQAAREKAAGKTLEISEPAPAHAPGDRPHGRSAEELAEAGRQGRDARGFGGAHRGASAEGSQKRAA